MKRIRIDNIKRLHNMRARWVRPASCNYRQSASLGGLTVCTKKRTRDVRFLPGPAKDRSGLGAKRPHIEGVPPPVAERRSVRTLT